MARTRSVLLWLSTVMILLVGTLGGMPWGAAESAAAQSNTGDGQLGPRLFLLGPMDAAKSLPAGLPVTVHARTVIVMAASYIASGPADSQARLQELGVPAITLDADTTGKVYYFLDTTGGEAAGPTAQLGSVLFAGESESLVSIPAADERAFLEEANRRGVPLAQLPYAAMAGGEGPVPEAMRAAPTGELNPVVSALLPKLTQETLVRRIGELSGVVPAPVGAGSITFTTRYNWGAQTRSVEQYLYESYLRLGLQPRYVIWTRGADSGRNVVVDLRGSVHPERLWLIGGHFDSNSNAPYSVAPGADDNATGTAATLAIANLLRSHQFADTIRFVHFGAEEQGMWGSRSYAANLKALGVPVMGFVDLDMIGWDSNADRVVELHSGTGSLSNALAAAFVSANARYGQGLSIEVKQTSASRFSDHSSFWDYGYPAFLGIENFFDDAIPRDRNPWYHSTGDVLARVDANYVLRFARAALATIAEQAGIFGPGTEPTGTPTGTPVPSATPTAARTSTATRTPTATSSPSATPTATPPVSAGCVDKVANGGFELTGSWTFPLTGSTAGYTTAQSLTGTRSARFGLLPAAQAARSESGPERNLLGDLAPLAASYSSGYQRVYIPPAADSVALNFWYRPGSQGADGDFQRVLLLQPSTYSVIATLMKVRENGTAWHQKSFDLAAYRGRYIVIYFEVYNDNISAGSRAWMNLDDVQVLACSATQRSAMYRDPQVWLPLLVQ